MSREQGGRLDRTQGHTEGQEEHHRREHLLSFYDCARGTCRLVINT